MQLRLALGLAAFLTTNGNQRFWAWAADGTAPAAV
jgi:hypothetical protein